MCEVKEKYLVKFFVDNNEILNNVGSYTIIITYFDKVTILGNIMFN